MIHHHFCIRCRFDRAGKKGILNGYFLWLTLGYAVGKCLIHLALYTNRCFIVANSALYAEITFSFPCRPFPYLPCPLPNGWTWSTRTALPSSMHPRSAYTLFLWCRLSPGITPFLLLVRLMPVTFISYQGLLWCLGG